MKKPQDHLKKNAETALEVAILLVSQLWINSLPFSSPPLSDLLAYHVASRVSLDSVTRIPEANTPAPHPTHNSVQLLSKDPMDCSTPGFPVHHQLPEFAQTHVHWVSDAIQPSHPLSSPSPPAFSLSQHSFVIKVLSKLGTEGNFLSMIKGIYRKPIADTRINGERLNSFLSKIKKVERKFVFTVSIQRCTGSSYPGNWARKK